MRRFALRPAVLWCVVACVFCALCEHVNWYWPHTSDQVGYFLAGNAFIHGNWRLHGWALTAPNVWTSEIPLAGILSAAWSAFGHSPISPRLLMLQPAIIWTTLVASLLALVRMRFISAGQRWGATLLILVLFAIPLLPTPTASFVTLSAIHLATVIYGVWALHHAARYLQTGRRGYLAAGGLLLGLGILGDPLLQVTGTLPILLFCGYRLGQGQGEWQRASILATVTLCVAALAPVLLSLNQATGGFLVEPISMQFVAWQDLGGTISTVLHDILLTCGGDPFGHSMRDGLLSCLRLGLFGLCLRGLCKGPQGGKPSTVAHGKDPFVELLLLAAFCDVASLLLSDRVSSEGFSIATVRYLFPGWAALSMVLALTCAGRKLVLALAAVTLVLTVRADAQMIARPVPGFLHADDGPLLEDLLREEPSLGIGSWWASLIYEMGSGGRITVLPAITDGSGHIGPFQHIHEHMTFDILKGRPFFVLVPTPTETYDEAAVLRTFGPPSVRRQVGRFVVLRYSGL
ncbi:hypothetical protein [Acetobacter conturbans]|uniref:Glycosyltransferase RgtA/B/C/D-like domain-containing protein n=1 Tax=Acetobacter conturbans TaxID=1737472 RepID=A0ABX0K0R9_9PROT|nr:hypothetical protein [Acetobacter conturbans]NHN87339.1 hypothetical protein [Acetobacter conturbans]